MKTCQTILGAGALALVLASCAGPASESVTEPAPGSTGEAASQVDNPSASGDDSGDDSDTVASDIVVTHPSEGSEAAVTEATFTGEPGAYQVAVTVTSPDTGCEQYADWWEVLSADGELLYRRILAHSHVEEQPFTRSGGPVAIAPTDLIFIRVHMNNTGYSSQVLQGTVANGMRTTALLIDPDADAALAVTQPQPSGCTF